MSPERRKAMIVAAALPLVAEYGTAVTTSQIAKAAGIGEATIFRVFADKEELLDACMNEALRPDHAVEQIASIPLDQPLADRLADAGFPRCPGPAGDDPHGAGGGDRGEGRLHGSADPGRLAHLHVRVTGSPGWRFALLVRDHLRADPGRRAEYQRLKRTLAAAGADPGAYAAGKESWFDQERERAEAWAAATGWRP